MAYVGPAPNPGQNREVDDISSGFNGSEVNFTLQVSSQNVSPGSANAIIVSLGGVVQNPGTDYTVAASTLTFTTAPASGLSFFGLVLGQQVDTQSVADASVTTIKIADDAVTAAKLASPLDLPDNQKIRFGTGNDLEIFHNATNSLLQNSTGYLGIRSDTLYLQDKTDGHAYITCVKDGAVGLRYDNTQTFETQTNGVKIDSAGDTILEMHTSNGTAHSRIQFSNNSGDNYGGLWYSSGNIMEFRTNNGEKMRIDSNGHIGLSPNGIDPSSNGGITVRQSSPTTDGPVMSFNTIQSGQGFTEFRSSGTQIGSIGKSGTTGVSYYSASDYRLKENQSLITDGITRLKVLKPYKFNWKADASTKVDGFFAHEVTPAVPEAITGTKDEVDENNEPIIQQIDHSKLVPLLTAALQEAITKIETLETKVAALEAA